MYGKPSPIGSGNGWSGWYKNIYFRSILELSTMIYFEKNNIKFESAERYRIPYFFFERERTYCPDFYLPQTDEYIECKYSKLINTPNVLAKSKAAKEHFNKFKFITEKDVPLVTNEQLLIAYKKQELKWNKLYEKLFKDRLRISY